MIRTILLVSAFTSAAVSMSASIASESVPVRGLEPAEGPALESVIESAGDAAITAKIKSRLLLNAATSGLDVHVTTNDGVVVLTGVVPSDTERMLVHRIVRATEGVQSVDDQLSFLPATASNDGGSSPPGEADGSLTDTVTDAWLTAKVKVALMHSAEVDGSSISVNTTDGIVTLSGQVSSERQRAAAMSVASNVDGVKQVRVALRLAPLNS